MAARITGLDDECVRVHLVSPQDTPRRDQMDTAYRGTVAEYQVCARRRKNGATFVKVVSLNLVYFRHAHGLYNNGLSVDLYYGYFIRRHDLGILFSLGMFR